jgi:hypothetical protein
MLPSACSFIVLVATVLHYMFRPTWPSSSVVYFYFHMSEGICFAGFFAFFLTWSHSARFYLWGGLNMRYYYLCNFWYCYICFLLVFFFVNFVVVSCVYVCLLAFPCVVCLFCAAICCLFRVVLDIVYLYLYNL